MRHLKSTAFLLTVALAVVLLGALTACGSSGPGEDSSPAASSPTASAMETYRNDEFGFSMTYPESYEVTCLGSASAEETTSLVFQVGFVNSEAPTPMFGDELGEGIVVSVSELSKEWSPEEVRQAEEEYRRIVSSALEGLENTVVIEPLQTAEINGVPGFELSYSFTRDGIELRTSTHMLIQGQHQYEVKAQAGADRWDAVSPELEAAVMSFEMD